MNIALYLGLGLTTFSLLSFELLLTRIFSVTMWYHFAFMAISLAMFGIAGGAILIEIRGASDLFTRLTKATLWFAISSVICLALQLLIPLDPETSLLLPAVVFVITTIPFVFAGVAICIALTQFRKGTASLYAADLAGSAAACLLFVPILDWIDAPSAVILNAGIAAVGAVLFSATSPTVTRKLRRQGIVVAITFGLLAAVNAQTHWISVRYTKGGLRWGKGLYEKWNALSRIHIIPFGNKPFGWGLSSAYKAESKVDQLYLNIDGAAGTVITKFDGTLEPLDYLRYDVTSLAHYLRSNGSALIIGVGGGRDVLTALRFGHPKVTGVEINHDILHVLKSRFADYSGNLEKISGVRLVHDEARSFITRTDEKFSIIQASLIDTWAATAAGAYVLSENGLYTKEAWKVFLERLDDDGILTMSRWYYEALPAETLRLASLASVSLLDSGVTDPRKHLIIVRKKDASESGQYSVATLLLCKRPFSNEEIDNIEDLANRMNFDLVLTPRFAVSDDFAAISDPARHSRFVEAYPLDLSAPTDDRPFFFHMLRARDVISAVAKQGMNDMNANAVKLIAALLIIVLVLSATVIALPAVFGKSGAAISPQLAGYFAAIGLAFMMIEIGQLERLIVFLGHPVFGLTVVLFVLLLSSSFGSAFSQRLRKTVWLLPVVLLAFTFLSPALMSANVSSSTALRILLSTVLIFPTGFFMGMCFPLGMARAAANAPTAWYWGINCAFSVIASVLSLAVAIFAGITATLCLGTVLYVIALLLLPRVDGKTAV